MNSRNKARPARYGLRSSKLPRKLRHVENSGNAFRRALEAAVLEAHGTITVRDASTIQSAMRHERRAMRIEMILARSPDLTDAEQLDLLRQSAEATDRRDRCIDRLRLDAEIDPLQAFFNQPDPEPGPDPSNASAGRTEPHNGDSTDAS
jgi:hypothetical protein